MNNYIYICVCIQASICCSSLLVYWHSEVMSQVQKKQNKTTTTTTNCPHVIWLMLAILKADEATLLGGSSPQNQVWTGYMVHSYKRARQMKTQDLQQYYISFKKPKGLPYWQSQVCSILLQLILWMHTQTYPIKLALLKATHRAMMRLLTLPPTPPLHSIITHTRNNPPSKHSSLMANLFWIFNSV